MSPAATAEKTSDVLSRLAVEPRMSDRRPGPEAQRRQGDGRAGEGHEILEGQRAFHLEDLGRGDLQLLGEEIDHPPRHALGDLQPHHGGETALAQLFLDGFQ